MRGRQYEAQAIRSAAGIVVRRGSPDPVPRAACNEKAQVGVALGPDEESHRGAQGGDPKAPLPEARDAPCKQEPASRHHEEESRHWDVGHHGDVPDLDQHDLRRVSGDLKPGEDGADHGRDAGHSRTGANPASEFAGRRRFRAWFHLLSPPGRPREQAWSLARFSPGWTPQAPRSTVLHRRRPVRRTGPRCRRPLAHLHLVRRGPWPRHRRG